MPIIASKGGTITVFPFKIYNIINDDYVPSLRMATNTWIQKNGAVKNGSSFEVPYEAVQDELTEIGYTPIA
jgi:hypothetical protein